jgi:demethylmenaquinone methyltransferase / 2-methoxy-6-polyprenyl-1,4-benzoquinol methylase
LKATSKEQHVHNVFESIASKYDFMNDLLSFRRHKAWRRFTMRKMGVEAGQTAIDLCCGTCDWTIALAEASKSGEVVGLDFSSNMLEIGRQKVERIGLQDRIRLVHGNAMQLPFDDNQFDYATIGFGLRNVPDLDKVLAEMTRVVKPGGKVVCLELSKPENEPFRSVYYFYFERILPFLGKLFAKRYEQYKWLPESLVSFPGIRQLADRFSAAGLENVQAYPLTLGIAALHIGTKGSDHASKD